MCGTELIIIIYLFLNLKTMKSHIDILMQKLILIFYFVVSYFFQVLELCIFSAGKISALMQAIHFFSLTRSKYLMRLTQGELGLATPLTTAASG